MLLQRTIRSKKATIRGGEILLALLEDHIAEPWNNIAAKLRALWRKE